MIFLLLRIAFLAECWNDGILHSKKGASAKSKSSFMAFPPLNPSFHYSINPIAERSGAKFFI
jgi:hypothetical protein